MGRCSAGRAASTPLCHVSDNPGAMVVGSAATAHTSTMIGRPPRWLPNLSPAGILRGLDGANLVGADLVEVAPVYDHAEITCIAASHVAFELLGLFARRR